MDKSILQYRISDWHQLKDCKSNTSPDLKISITDFINNDEIQGTRVSINHPQYGSLFSMLVGDYCYGSLLAPISDTDFYAIDSEQIGINQVILKELARYGFYVFFNEEEYLPVAQIEFLKAIKTFNFDKMKLVSVFEDKDLTQTKIYVAAYNIEALPSWINAGYSPSRSEWSQAISKGYALNVSAICRNPEFKWDWMYNQIVDLNLFLEKYENIQNPTVPIAPIDPDDTNTSDDISGTEGDLSDNSFDLSDNLTTDRSSDSDE